MRYVGFITALVLASFGVAQDADFGRDQFFGLCAQCHGETARGDGSMAPVLTIAPPDLTGLAAANDGVFPMAEVVRRIDGTIDVAAHGGAMPVFGLMLQGPSGVITTADGEVVAPEVILDIAAWLETIQE